MSKNILDEIFDAIQAYYNDSDLQTQDRKVKYISSGQTAMIIEIDGDQYLIQKR